MVWPDERWMMWLMVGGKRGRERDGERERQRAVVLIVQHITYCTQSFDSQRSHTDSYRKKEKQSMSLLLLIIMFCFSYLFHSNSPFFSI